MSQATPPMSAHLVDREKAHFLHGIKAIAAYMGKSKNTTLKYIEREGLPAVKIGGEWVSDEGRIDEWRMGRINKK